MVRQSGSMNTHETTLKALREISCYFVDRYFFLPSALCLLPYCFLPSGSLSQSNLELP
jgi:hypothetical protein